MTRRFGSRLPRTGLPPSPPVLTASRTDHCLTYSHSGEPIPAIRPWRAAPCVALVALVRGKPRCSPLALCGSLSAHCSLAFHASHADARADARACNFVMDVVYRCMQLLPYAGLLRYRFGRSVVSSTAARVSGTVYTQSARQRSQDHVCLYAAGIAGPPDPVAGAAIGACHGRGVGDAGAAAH